MLDAVIKTIYMGTLVFFCGLMYTIFRMI